MTTFDSIISNIRNNALTERDKGTAFENIVKKWLLVDPVQGRRLTKVETYREWARGQGLTGQDTGTDLVGTLLDGRFMAIQAKLYSPGTIISKSAIDSFIADTAKECFAERLIVETSEKPWTTNARDTFLQQSLPSTVIGMETLRQSAVDWSQFEATGHIVRYEPKKLRPDQKEALEQTMQGFMKADRGKLIMACGTGKTMIGLRVAEEIATTSGNVLVLVPSLSLMSQTIREWCQNTRSDLVAFAVCSDTQVGRRRRYTEDVAELDVTDLALPATTDARRLANEYAKYANRKMRVVFATYQSLTVIEDAQKRGHMPTFDLIICDEAHRTTGITLVDEEESNFVKVHDNEAVRGSKRLYMTATPRIYGENARQVATDAHANLASMDDDEKYGKVFFHHSFGRAVESGILTDYRVIVLAMDEGAISTAVQDRLADDEGTLALDDATKIVGCWKALTKSGLIMSEDESKTPMKRALAFCKNIRSSQTIANEFPRIIAEYQAQNDEEQVTDLICEVRHVDGKHRANERNERLNWLKKDREGNICRILSNAKCLTEGVDVPALDAIMFLHPRKSQIDVVQAVGRVMRKAPGKRMGYVILPIGIPPGVRPEEALNDNIRYKVVWQILNALRAHDERLDAVINQGGLGQDINSRIAIINGRSDPSELQAVTATVDTINLKQGIDRMGIGHSIGEDTGETSHREYMPLFVDEFTSAVLAKIVEKCGTRYYWEDWAKDVALIAERHVTRITSLVAVEGSDAQSFFRDFLKELKENINQSITEVDAIEMLAQHLITRPVFEALFEGESLFTDKNPVSRSMQELLPVIDEKNIEREAEDLEKFYASVQRRAKGVTDACARQNLITELYEKFFSKAFKKTSKKLGIVYTPMRIVDFIIHSINDILHDEFGQTLSSQGVHILDPFTGTGSFITRLIQTGVIPPEDLERKYREEIHANEIVLLAYYIAAINIETVFRSVAEKEDYTEFPGICFTDTFAMQEGKNAFDFYMPDNSGRIKRQNEKTIQVILGNPPWRAAQKDHDYKQLSKRIRDTYVERSTATNRNSLYDSYKMAIRWASDRIGEKGVIGMVTNGSWLDGNVDSGVRACLAEEFSTIHVLNLRGHINKFDKKEGGNVFNVRVPVSIIFLIKNPEVLHQGCKIHYRDIGDHLSIEEKLNILTNATSLKNIEGWQKIEPDKRHDWIAKQEKGFENLYPLGSKEVKAGKTNGTIFELFSNGYKTGRDAYIYNFSKDTCAENAQLMINDYQAALADNPSTEEAKEVASMHSNNSHWDRELLNNLKRGKEVFFSPDKIIKSQYRPFVKQNCYADYNLASMKYQQDRIFPVVPSTTPPRKIGQFAFQG